MIFYYCLVTLFPVYALCLFAYLIAPDATGLDLLLLTPLRATVYCLLAGASISLVLLAFSSLGKRSIFVMVWWTIMVSGTETIGAIAEGLGKRLGAGGQFPGPVPQRRVAAVRGAGRGWTCRPGSAWLIVLAWTAAAMLVLRRRIRPVEVVS